MKRWLGIALILVTVIGTWVLRPTADPGGNTWARVERRDVVLEVKVEGELRAVRAIELGPPAVGWIWDFKISFLAPEGSEVRPGQTVLTFDSSELDKNLQQKITERDSTEKELERRTTDLASERNQRELQLAEAEARLRRASLKTSVPQELAAAQELAESKVDVRLAELEIGYLKRSLELLARQTAAELAALREKRDQAAARVREIEQDMAKMRITAPQAGTVIYKSERRNSEKKKVGDSAWRGEKILEIPDLSEMVGKGEIEEADVGKVAVGQPVSFRLDAYLDQEYRGQVKSIRGTVQQKSPRQPQKIVKLEIALAATDTLRMRPGMRFRGTIETERIPGALAVPLAAIQPQADGRVAVYVRRLIGQALTFPQFGRCNSAFCEVLAGLEAGDEVLLHTAAMTENRP